MNSPVPSWGSLAYLTAGIALALSRLIAWPLVESGPPIAGVFDAAQVLAVSAVAAALAFGGDRLEARAPRGALIALGVVSLGLASFTLSDDVDGFSRRQEVVPAAVAFYGSIFLIAMAPVVAALIGRLLDRPWGRWGALGGAIAVSIVNGVILPNDYFGVHLFLALCCLVGAGRAIEGGERYPARLRTSWALCCAIILGSLAWLVPLPAQVNTAMASSTGAAYFRFLNFGDQTIGPSSAPADEWHRSRAQAPPVPAQRTRPVAAPPIVILLTVDALRADVVLSGKHDADLPTLTKLRKEGLSFTQARSAGTLTKTALASMFMGVHFSQQYWSKMENRNGALTVHADEGVRFTELLHEAGVFTANYRSVNWLRNGVVMRGFEVDRYVKYPKKKSYYTPSPPIFKGLLPEIQKSVAKGRASFIYSHLSDPHAPYDQGKVKKGSAYQRYLSEVALVDSQLWRLVDFIEGTKDPSNILLIISADHGEAFGEHNSETHGTTMYDEGLHVPMLFWSKDMKPRKVDDLVSLIDLGPTVLDLFELPTPGHFMGQSLVPYLNGESPRLTRPILAETRLMRALVTPERMKLIVDTRSGRTELYDLSRDPKELVNLADDVNLVRGPRAQMERFFEVHTLRRDGYVPPFVK